MHSALSTLHENSFTRSFTLVGSFLLTFLSLLLTATTRRCMFSQISNLHDSLGVSFWTLYCLCFFSNSYSSRNDSSYVSLKLLDLLTVSNSSLIDLCKYLFCLYSLSPFTFVMYTASFLPDVCLETSGQSKRI